MPEALAFGLLRVAAEEVWHVDVALEERLDVAAQHSGQRHVDVSWEALVDVAGAGESTRSCGRRNASASVQLQSRHFPRCRFPTRIGRQSDLCILKPALQVPSLIRRVHRA